jgi:hypothetical protein
MDEATRAKISYFESQERIFLDRAEKEPDRKAEHLRTAEAWRRLAQFRRFLTAKKLEAQRENPVASNDSD